MPSALCLDKKKQKTHAADLKWARMNRARPHRTNMPPPTELDQTKLSLRSFSLLYLSSYAFKDYIFIYGKPSAHSAF